MSYLLDTSSLLWFVSGDSRLSASASNLLRDADSVIYLSVASIWELAIKSNLGRGLELPQPFPIFIDQALEIERFRLLNITVSHLKRVADLPLFHRDPFDRLLIAQSLVENIPVISNDRAFDAYQIQRVW